MKDQNAFLKLSFVNAELYRPLNALKLPMMSLQLQIV